MLIADGVAAAGFVVTAIGVTLALLQLGAAKDIARAQFMLDVDQALQTFESLRHKINLDQSLEDDEKKVAVRRYVGAFERVGLLVARRHLDIRQVNELYGSRLEKLLVHHENLVDFVTQRPDSWRGFVYLWSELRKQRTSLPTPPAASG